MLRVWIKRATTNRTNTTNFYCDSPDFIWISCVCEVLAKGPVVKFPGSAAAGPLGIIPTLSNKET
jgi:hypothetical protein